MATVLEGADGPDADKDILKAAFADARETLAAFYKAFLEDLRTEETVRERSVQILTCAGWVKAEYPYAPKAVTGREAVRRLCGEEQAVRTESEDGKKSRGLPKATREARRRIAESVALLGSVDEAQRFLAEVGGLAAGRETERQIALEAGRRTQEAARKGELAAKPGRKWTPPEGAVAVVPTLVLGADGKAFRCVKADLRGRRRKDGGAAQKRNANVLCSLKYSWVDAQGRPLFGPGHVHYRVTEAGGPQLGEEVRRLAFQEGAADVGRVEYLTDGERELECVHRDFLAAAFPGKVVRVLDAMHACEYVDQLAKVLEKDADMAAKRSQKLRKRLVDEGWEGFETGFRSLYGADAETRLSGEGRTAWDYLWKRRAMMDYRRCREQGLFIGSGMVESACKLLIGTRLEGPGMHWRFRNGIRIAVLRAAIHSRQAIAA